MDEWSVSKKWNPFNSYKLLAHVYRWRLIRRSRPVPQPVLVTVDPINACDLSCVWCNARYVLRRRRERIAPRMLRDLAEGLARWQGSPHWPGGVEAVCLAGGGEPLLHPHIDEFIHACREHGIEVGVVTNGTRIADHMEALSRCTWVGVSVDAGTPDLFRELKGRDLFHTVCENIRKLNDYIARTDCRLGKDRPGYGVTYKYLLWNGNLQDVLPAVCMAKELGCRNFHLRPGGIAWDRLDREPRSLFEPNVHRELARQIEAARSLEDDRFAVYGITHKFDSDLNRANRFRTCHAVFMTAVFMPPRPDRDERFSVALCCDRRGDPTLEFSGPFQRFSDLQAAWGSDEHWARFDAIRVEECPRCTYQPHNQIFEHVIQEDGMTYRFI